MKAPDFSLPNQDGKEIKLQDFKEKWVILYFYPKDDTPGCTLEARAFTEYLKEFEKLNAKIIGISADNEKSHCKFIKKHNLKINLLSDIKKEIIKKYGAWGKKNLYGKKFEGIIRSTFLINPNRELVYSWKKVKAEGHIEEVLNRLKKQ
ncbi:thioredoxin-dependent thiol peroxidase [Candidatus Pacearchaeota archaeon]|nr:thioredoxin-dependent thiol peroxidase [Candidatus Pacearchaeota archaeon]